LSSKLSPPQPPTAAPGRPGPGQEKIAAVVFKKLRLQIRPGLQSGTLQTEADGGTDITQFIII